METSLTLVGTLTDIMNIVWPLPVASERQVHSLHPIFCFQKHNVCILRLVCVHICPYTWRGCGGWRWRAGSGTLWAAAACCCSTRALFLARKGGSSGFTWRTPANTSTSSMWEGIEFLVHLTPAPTLPLSNGHCWSAGGGVEGGVEEEERRRRQYSLSQTQHTHSPTHSPS